MIDIDTFLTYLYVMVDDFCKQHPSCERHPGPSASLSCSEVVTLALFGQWCHFSRERDFSRYARRHLRSAFPGLPDRAQFNRLMRRYAEAVVACFLDLVKLLDAPQCAYEALDGTAAVPRDAKRRGSGWLPGLADIGWGTAGAGTRASTCGCRSIPWGDHRLRLRFGQHQGPAPGRDVLCPASVPRSAPAHGRRPGPRPYVTDKGFAGQARQRDWQDAYGAGVICAPKPTASNPGRGPGGGGWAVPLNRRYCQWLPPAALPSRSRTPPHPLDGFQVRLTAKIALHNGGKLPNQRLGRAPLAFADLVAW